MPKVSLAERKQYRTNLDHRQAVDGYLIKHGRAARIERAKQGRVAIALENCDLYCPGEPHGDHPHSSTELTAAIERPKGVILSCGVTYSRVLRVKRETEESEERMYKAWQDDLALMQMEDEIATGSELYQFQPECLDCEKPIEDENALYCDDCRVI